MRLVKFMIGAVLIYLGSFVLIFISPFILIFWAWAGLCMLTSVFLFLFWLFGSHDPHNLMQSLYMLGWGIPAVIAYVTVGYVSGIQSAKRQANRAVAATNQDVSFY
jgi:hypothetical protein